MGGLHAQPASGGAAEGHVRDELPHRVHDAAAADRVLDDAAVQLAGVLLRVEMRGTLCSARRFVCRWLDAGWVGGARLTSVGRSWSCQLKPGAKSRGVRFARGAARRWPME